MVSEWCSTRARGSGMVSSDPRGAIYYNTGCQYAAQWYDSGSMAPWGPGVLEWSPAPHEGLDTL